MSTQDVRKDITDDVKTEAVESTPEVQKEAPDGMAFMDRIPFPACLVGPDDSVKYANQLMSSVFTYKNIEDTNFFALTGVRRSELIDAVEGPDPVFPKIERNDSFFELHTDSDATTDGDMVVYFYDVTEREELRIHYNEERICLAYISIDNYDELMSSITEDSKMAVPTEVDRILRKWAEKYNGSLESTSEDTYVFTLFRRDAEQIIDTKFEILDRIRNIEAKIDFPVSISIGMGFDGETMEEEAELAEAALELAMGRGGDQAVVKDRDRTKYYGGKLQSMEKNNKGKSRIIAHALRQLIKDSGNVLIMGHKWPDMDSFGSAIGAYKIARYYDKEAEIVIDEYNEALQEIMYYAHERENYPVISSEKALEICDRNTLVIVVDTHRPGRTACPELMDIAEKVVVIDHHRLSEDAIENPVLSYVESYASSTSELMTEIIQYTANKRIIKKFDAEALLAGITVDSNSFSIKTGVRTFEAAAWLRRAGADTTEVKRFFQMEISTFQMRADAIAHAEYTEDGVAYAITEGYSADAQVINAQVADQLLNVKGVRASFAAGKNNNNKTVVSGRSLGGINVQVILERFNGGGHLNSAGAQVDEPPEEVIGQIKEVISEYVEEQNRKKEKEKAEAGE